MLEMGEDLDFGFFGFGLDRTGVENGRGDGKFIR